MSIYNRFNFGKFAQSEKHLVGKLYSILSNTKIEKTLKNLHLLEAARRRAPLVYEDGERARRMHQIHKSDDLPRRRQSWCEVQFATFHR